jgi:hypothetical protein
MEGLGVALVALGTLSACGSNGTQQGIGTTVSTVAATTSVSTPVSQTTRTTATTPTTAARTTAAPPSSAATTAAKAKQKVSYPAGGAVDPVFPPGDQAYTMLVQGQCDVLLTKTKEWDTKGVAGSEGADTVFMYRSAAEACLQRWTDAVRDFERVTKPAPDFGTNCARREAYGWVSALIAAYSRDPAFAPVFVAATGQSPCAATTTSSPATSVPSTSTTAKTATTATTR